MSIRTGVLGASGYGGSELLRLLATHPSFDLVAASGSTKAGERVTSLNPALLPYYRELKLCDSNPSNFKGLDLVFLALPHGLSLELAPVLLESFGVSHVVDLSADFRLKDKDLYKKWYGFDHNQEKWLKTALYGLPEINREDLKGAQLVAVAGCYVTAAALCLAPLVQANLIDKVGVIVNGASGVSGAGRKVDSRYLFASLDENYFSYGVSNHRHTPEMEQVTGAQILFTPHLLPINRGILTTCYARPSKDMTITPDILSNTLRDYYKDDEFVDIVESPPEVKSTLGSNYCQIFATYDERTNYVMAFSVLDNLIKGAAGQAIQCANLVFGFKETLGLSALGIYP
ncbi:MAG: N-acetyl-gamma-glutamyl-phosphate reductase [Acidimicrobiales bacterium]|nr:N-acetyl-gamma-glutamyl-phosphate reductase [Acidimicrobiales bacterium]